MVFVINAVVAAPAAPHRNSVLIDNIADVAVDSRFRDALTAINRQFPDQPPISLTVQANSYLLQQQQRLLYQFSEADFYNLYHSLKVALKTLGGYPKPSETKLSFSRFEGTTFSPQALIKQAKQHNIAAKTQDEALKKVVSSLILLNFFAYDELDMMDAVQSDAWWLLAWLEVRSGVRDQVLLTMLADNLGYTVYAQYAADKISGKDTDKNSDKIGDSGKQLLLPPLSAFYHQNEAIADQNTPIAQLLRIKKAALSFDTPTWKDAVEATANLPASSTMMLYRLRAVEAYNIRSKLLLLYPLMLYYDFLGTDIAKPLLYADGKLNLSIESVDRLSSALAKPLKFDPAYLISEFDAAINKDKLSAEGVLNEQIFANYWRARLLNAYYDIAVYLTQIENDAKLADSLLEIFRNNARSDTGALLYYWFDVMASDDAYQKSVDKFTLMATANVTSITLLQALLDRQYYLKPTITPAYEQARKTLLNKLDTRYRHQTKRFKLLAQSGKLATNFALPSDSYRLNDDLIDGLAALSNAELLQQALPLARRSDHQARLLRLIFANGGGYADLLRRLADLYRQHGNSFYFLQQYVETLLFLGQSEQAIKELDDWIIERRDLSRNDYLTLIGLIARAKMAIGDTEAAWRTVSPALAYQRPAILLIAADIALAQQQIETTNRLIANYKRRLPTTPDSLAYQLKSLCLQKKYDAAAELVANWYYRLDDKQFNRYVIQALTTISLTKKDKQQLLQAMTDENIAASQLRSLKLVFE